MGQEDREANKKGKTIAHKILHLFGWNTGHIATKWSDDGYLWVAFECSECGSISGRYRTKTKRATLNKGEENE